MHVWLPLVFIKHPPTAGPYVYSRSKALSIAMSSAHVLWSAVRGEERIKLNSLKDWKLGLSSVLPWCCCCCAVWGLLSGLTTGSFESGVLLLCCLKLYWSRVPGVAMPAYALYNDSFCCTWFCILSLWYRYPAGFCSNYPSTQVHFKISKVGDVAGVLKLISLKRNVLKTIFVLLIDWYYLLKCPSRQHLVGKVRKM